MFAVEYSEKQKSYNIDKLSNILEKNRKDYINKNFENDYKILGILKTYEEAKRLIKALKKY